MGEAADRLVRTEGGVERVEMGEAVEQRQDGGLRADGRADRRDGGVEVVGLAAQQDEVEPLIDGGREPRLDRRVAGRARE